MCVCISCAIRTRQTRPPPLHPLRVFQRLRVVLRGGRRGALGMGRKILRHVRRFLRGLVILKRHRADYYICSQFQVLLKHSVVPLAHVYAGLDLSVKKRKKRKKKRKDIRFITRAPYRRKECVIYATFNDPINFNEDSFYFAHDSLTSYVSRKRK